MLPLNESSIYQSVHTVLKQKLLRKEMVYSCKSRIFCICYLWLCTLFSFSHIKNLLHLRPVLLLIGSENIIVSGSSSMQIHSAVGWIFSQSLADAWCGWCMPCSVQNYCPNFTQCNCRYSYFTRLEGIMRHCTRFEKYFC